MLKLAALSAVPGSLGSLVAKSAFAQGAPLQARKGRSAHLTKANPPATTRRIVGDRHTCER